MTDSKQQQNNSANGDQLPADAASVSLSTWRCSKKPDMYLFTKAGFTAGELLDALPLELLTVTGRLVHALDLDLRPERKLARASAIAVLESVAAKGWYLQMPPGDMDSELLRTIISAESSGNRPL